MSILSGFKKYKNYRTDSNGDHQLQSFWTSSDTVEVDSTTHKTLTTKLSEIDAEFASLPEPMVFRGTVGAQADNPTITVLPVDGTATIGDTYKVITDGTYASTTAEVGDTFICDTKTTNANTWVRVPSGDETIVIANPSGEATDELKKVSIDGTVYSVATEPEGSKTATGNPITLTDASESYAEELEVTLEPIQDLHGYDKPWVGGAGKNKLDPLGNETGEKTTYGITFTPLSDGTIKVNGTATGQARFYFKSNMTFTQDMVFTIEGSSFSGVTGYCSLGNVTSSKTIPANTDMGTTFIYVASGNTVNNVIVKPMISVEGGDFAPYSNICPITGYTEVNVGRVGKNKLPITLDRLKTLNTGGTWNNNVYTYNGGTVTALLDNDGNVCGFDVDGTFTAQSNISFTDTTNGVNPGATCILSGPSENSFFINTRYVSSPYDWAGTKNASGGEVTIAFERARWIYLQIGAATYSHKKAYPMLRLSTVTDSTYEPYKSSSAHTPLGRTVYGGMVYGGTVDIVSGELVVDKGYEVFDGSDDENWWNSSGGARAVTTLSNQIKGATNTRLEVISNEGYFSNSENNTGVIFGWSSGSELYFYPPNDASDISAFKTWLSSNPLQVCYELATPQTYQLTPAELKLLKQYNYITTNGTTISLKYQPDNVIGEAIGVSEEYTDRAIAKVGIGLEIIDDLQMTNSTNNSGIVIKAPVQDTSGTYTRINFPNHMMDDGNLCSHGYLSYVLGDYETNGFGSLAGVNKDGSSSTKYLRGDGTWQSFPSIPAAQVQSDWNQTTTTAVDYIKNKPTIPAAQIQSDWNQTDTTKKDYIKNKPTIPTVSGVVSTSANGLAPKVTNTSNYLKGDGTWSSPANNAVTVTNRTGSSYNNNYPVVFGTNTGTGTVTEGLQKRGGDFTYNPYTEKLSVYQETVESTLKVGVANSSNGYIDFHRSSQGYRGELQITTDGLTADQNYYLPNETGTLATREYLNSNLRCNKLDSFVTITSYTATNKYTFPDDGYLWFSGGSTSDSNITLAGSNGTEIWCTFNTDSKPQMVFVRKGMKCWLTANNSATVRFFKLYD